MARPPLHRLLAFAKEIYRYLSFASPELGFARYRGVFRSFAEAARAAPRGMRIGHDHEALARAYGTRLELRLGACEYAVLFHLSRILADRRSAVVLDFGGNVGIHYLRYRKHLDPETVRWIVCDVPAVTRIGRETCAGLPNVAFINDVAEFAEPAVDVLLAVGSLQYLERPDRLVPDLIGRGLRPRHLLIEELPVHDGARFVTLQNGGHAVNPTYVFNQDEWVEGLSRLGYDLVEAWGGEQGPLTIPFHRGIAFFSRGFYFRDTLAREERA